ncbi:btb poz-like protein [Apiospora hydei]|uniref:Btb poz-like protein n=1 Tax=Apiospora hydei TaxID=1337664 RepID=A0ABR1VIH8_9PEZI
MAMPLSHSSSSDNNGEDELIETTEPASIDETEKMLSPEKLLKCGDLSDVKVSCGEQSWDLHKAILCSRCPFFERALVGQFQEARTSHVILRENDPDEVDGVIEYIYTGKAYSLPVSSVMSNHLLKDENTAAYVKMFELGDFFDLPSLRQHALQLLDDEFLAGLVEDVCRHREWGNPCKCRRRDVFKCHPDKLASLRHVVEFAYGGGVAELQLDTYEPVRRLLRQFVARTFMQVVRLPTFRKLLRKVPALGADLFLSMAEGDKELGAHLLVDPPYSCRSCGQCLHSFKDTRAEADNLLEPTINMIFWGTWKMPTVFGAIGSVITFRSLQAWRSVGRGTA